MWHLNKIPKTLHIYWGGGRLSYLRYLTLVSFKYFNPDWEIILYTPLIKQNVFYWRSGEQEYGDNYIDCWNRVENLGITIQKVDFSKIGFYNDASEVHKSDYLRWKILYETGGLWADMDILFTKPIDDICCNKPEFFDIDVVYCLSNLGHSIGFLMGGKGNNYFKTIFEVSKREYRREGYQSIGSLLCSKVFPVVGSVVNKNLNSYNLPMDVVYAYDSFHVGYLFESYSKNKLTANTIGIHWYGGNKKAGEYLNNTNGGIYCQGDSMIDMQIRRINVLTKPNKKPDNSKISIVMAFYNRQELLDKTLESIDKSVVKDYELIIVDDASTVPLVCDRAKIIRVEKEDKWYNCSAVAWNRGMREATGDIIILNSPECYHAGDILSYVRNNIRSNLYLSFGCYSISKQETENFHKGVFPNIVDAVVNGRTGWYNHTKHRPVAYHFCSAMLKKDMDMIGGFDERYAYGVAFDDDEFIRTVKYMGMDIKIVNQPYVIHQYHTHFEFESASMWKEPHALNHAIYSQGYNAKIHRDYGRNADPFDPIEFKRATTPIDTKAKKKILLQAEDSQILVRFLKNLGGA